MLYPSILFWAFPHKRAKTPPHHLPYRLGVEYVEAEVLGCSLWLSSIPSRMWIAYAAASMRLMIYFCEKKINPAKIAKSATSPETLPQ
jgi:hypothetical protein